MEPSLEDIQLAKQLRSDRCRGRRIPTQIPKHVYAFVITGLWPASHRPECRRLVSEPIDWKKEIENQLAGIKSDERYTCGTCCSSRIIGFRSDVIWHRSTITHDENPSYDNAIRLMEELTSSID